MNIKSFAVLAVALMGLSAQAQVLIYTNAFDGTGNPINGTSPTDGGGTWIANSIVTDAGVINNAQGSAVLPFNPVTNKIYTLSIDLNHTSAAASWFGLGFCASAPANNVGGSSSTDRFSNTPTGYAWMLYNETKSVVTYEGPKAGLTSNGAGGPYASGVHKLTIIINTTGDGSTFTANYFVDGVSVTGGPVLIDAVTVAGIHYVGFSQTTGVTGTIGNFSLTQISLCPWNPSPANAAAGVNTNVAFAWNTARDPLNTGSPDPRVVSNSLQYIAYDLNSAVPTVPDFQNGAAVTVQFTNSTDPARYPSTGTIAFSNNKRVFWQVKHILNTGGTIPGPVWQFDTLVNSPMDIMQYWAPVVYQDFQTGVDFGKQLYGAKDAFVALNFDGNWTVANNWSNSIYQVDQQGAGNAPLNGKVYSSFIESAGFYFMKYGFYHAGQDSGDYLGQNARHQNDWEVIVLAIRKDGTDHGHLEAMVTQAHTGVNLYTNANLQFSQQRPIIYIEPNGLVVGHGISAYSNQSPGPDGAVYTPDTFSENVVSCTLSSSGNWATAPNYKYKLIPLGEIWGMRGYSSVFATTKLLAYDPSGEVAGGYLTWDKPYFYDPINYFRTNFTTLATTLASDQYVFNPYNGYDSSQTGPANPMAVFPASEWLTTVIGGGFGEAWPYRSGCTLYRKHVAGSDSAYNYRAISGDFEIATRVDSVQVISNHKAGLMIRQNLATNSPFMFLSVSSDQQVHVSYRNVTGGSITTGPDGVVPSDDRPVWIKLERKAGAFKASYSYSAVPSYSTLLQTNISTNSSLVCGLASASTATTTWGAASFSEVAVAQLAAEPPVLVGITQTGSTSFNILFTGTVGTQYILQETASLTNGWTDVGAAATCVTGTNSLPSSSSAPAMFWRVRQFP